MALESIFAMRNFWIVALLLSTLAWAQVKPAPPKPTAPPAAAADDDDDDDQPQAPPASADSVPATAAVLTIKGVCDHPAPKTAAPSSAAQKTCQTVVTRAQFEKLASAISPSMTPQVKRQLAGAYPRLLAMAHNAERLGLDRTQRVADLQRFSRLQILAQEMVREIQEESAKVPEKAIADYYETNKATFEQATLQRIFVPTRKRTDPLPKDKADQAAINAQQKEAEDAMTQEADALRLRAVAGEDFNQLQDEAFAAAGIKTSTSARNLDHMRRTSVPPAHQTIFDLSPGQVSPVITDASGHYIYKLDSKELLTLDAVEVEIKNKLETEKTQAAMKKIQDSFTTDMNDDYFGVLTPVKTPPEPEGMMHSRIP
jgi:PPIC-type PPIASE domain